MIDESTELAEGRVAERVRQLMAGIEDPAAFIVRDDLVKKRRARHLRQLAQTPTSLSARPPRWSRAFFLEHVMSFDDFPCGTARTQHNALLATAAWLTTGPAYEEGGFWLGLDPQGREIGIKDDRHAVLVA